MTDCIFCKIIAGLSEASIVFQDDICTAFLTVEPVTPGHTLVVPNRHAKNIHDIPTATAGHMLQIAQIVSNAYARTDIKCEGVNIVMCNGEAASQTVLHAHIHVNPRFHGDGFSWNMPENFGRPPNRTELDQIADKMRTAIESAI